MWTIVDDNKILKYVILKDGLKYATRKLIAPPTKDSNVVGMLRG